MSGLSRRLGPLRPFALAAWNGTVHGGRRLGELAAALAGGRLERCDVCGGLALMLLRPGVVPPRLVELWGLTEREAAALVRKESLDCSRCGAKLRARRLAAVLLEEFPAPERPPTIRSWVDTPTARNLRVAEINRVDGLHRELSRLPGWTYSEYLEGVRPGEIPDGVRCEDLSRLTYADNSFDLVLTSETLEHLPDLDRALAEIRRVLRPGGRHLFTAPVRPNLSRGFRRAAVHPDGSLEPLATPVCHPGGDVGYPVFHEFGADFADQVRSAGFEVETRFGPTTEDDLAQVYIARKP